MNILILGSGGREHALSNRLSLDSRVQKIWVCPGNSGISRHSSPKVSCTLNEITGNSLLEFCLSHSIKLVVIGPEKYLYAGVVDLLRSQNILVFGPGLASTFLECSKRRAKEFMKEFGIPTADFAVVDRKESAASFIDSHASWKKIVIKLSGPALGKGVFVCDSSSEAKSVIEDLFQDNPQGIEDGIVIEKGLEGQEISLFYVCDGSRAVFLASATDHKRLLNSDHGPNTGGMGAYSPALDITESFLGDVKKRFVDPTLLGMSKRGAPFSGVLFLGIMMDHDEPYLLEYNIRFGDPETQAFLPLLKGDFLGLLETASKGDLESFDTNSLILENGFSVHVVKTARGYPGLFGAKIEREQEILKHPLSKESDIISREWIFSGVSELNGKLITSGGRVCGPTVKGTDLETAVKNAYSVISEYGFQGEHFRTDIGAKRS